MQLSIIRSMSCARPCNVAYVVLLLVGCDWATTALHAYVHVAHIRHAPAYLHVAHIRHAPAYLQEDSIHQGKRVAGAAADAQYRTGSCTHPHTSDTLTSGFSSSSSSLRRLSNRLKILACRSVPLPLSSVSSTCVHTHACTHTPHNIPAFRC